MSRCDHVKMERKLLFQVLLCEGKSGGVFAVLIEISLKCVWGNLVQIGTDGRGGRKSINQGSLIDGIFLSYARSIYLTTTKSFFYCSK